MRKLKKTVTKYSSLLIEPCRFFLEKDKKERQSRARNPCFFCFKAWWFSKNRQISGQNLNARGDRCVIEFEVTVQCGARALFASNWSTNFYIKFSVVGFLALIVRTTPLTLKISLISPKLHFLRLLIRFFFQKKSAFISLSATFFYWWKTVLFFEISRKRALHHTVIILAFFHFLIYARAWLGQKTFSANLASWKNPFTLWIQLLHGRNHQKNEKFEMTSFLTVSKARGLWGAEIASKSVITELTLSGHLRAESFNQIFGKK